MTTRLQWGVCSDVGRLRELNEDSVIAAPPVFGVADGMGGHAAGEVASALARRAMSGLEGRTDLRREDVVAAIDAANRSILEESRARGDTAGMGTTLTGICLGSAGGSPHWFVYNVGDSRVYRVRRGRLEQITTDHSEVEELVAAGRLTPEQARTHPRRNVVTRSLGTDPAPVPDVWLLPVEDDDAFLICSDGLTTELDPAAIRAVVAEAGTAQETADRLCAMAVSAGGRDNVSVIIVRVVTEAGAADVDVATAPRPRLPREA